MGFLGERLQNQHVPRPLKRFIRSLHILATKERMALLPSLRSVGFIFVVLALQTSRFFGNLFAFLTYFVHLLLLIDRKAGAAKLLVSSKLG